MVEMVPEWCYDGNLVYHAPMGCDVLDDNPESPCIVIEYFIFDLLFSLEKIVPSMQKDFFSYKLDINLVLNTFSCSCLMILLGRGAKQSEQNIYMSTFLYMGFKG